MIQIHNATPELLARTRLPNPQRTIRGLVAIDSDTNEPVGLVAMYADGHRMVMLADLSDQIRQDKRTLVRGYRAILAMAAKHKAPVHAIADPDIPGSAALLEHMGFEHLNGDLYQWHS